MTEPLGFGLRDRVRAVELLEDWSRAVTDDLPDPEFDLTIPRPWSRPRFALNAVIGTLTVLLVAAVAVRVGFNIASRAVPPAAAEAAAVPAAAAPKKSGGTAKEITVQTVRDGGAAGRTRDEIVSRLRGLGYEVRSGQAGLNWSGEPSVVIGYDLDILPDATGRPEEIRAALDGELATHHPDFTVLAPACTEPAGKGAARTLMVITKGVDAGLRFELGQAVSSLYPPRSAKTLPCA